MIDALTSTTGGQNRRHTASFVDAGGFDAVLKSFPLSQWQILDTSPPDAATRDDLQGTVQKADALSQSSSQCAVQADVASQGGTQNGLHVTGATSSSGGGVQLGTTKVTDLFATPEEERAFSKELTERLNSMGVDTSKPIKLTVDFQGHVVAAPGTPDKDKIDNLFANDFNLRNEYVKIANTETTKALVKAQQAYMRQAEGASKEVQDYLYENLIRFSQNIDSVGGDMTLSGGTLQSAAADMVSGLC